jgi:hypothetical protein
MHPFAVAHAMTFVARPGLRLLAEVSRSHLDSLSKPLLLLCCKNNSNEMSPNSYNSSLLERSVNALNAGITTMGAVCDELPDMMTLLLLKPPLWSSTSMPSKPSLRDINED